MKTNNLPTLAELHHDSDLAVKNDSLKLLLNNKPPQEWVKPHPFAKNKGVPIPYIPIGRVEMLMDKIFQEWRVEVKEVQQLFNSVQVTIRLHYRNPIDAAWSFHDGVGAVGVQTNKGASASDLSAIKQDAIMKAVPAAKSYAMKDAADHFGVLFGRDLNRPDDYDFKPSHVQDNREIQRIMDWLNSGNVSFNQLIEFKESGMFTKYEDNKEMVELVIKLEGEL